MNIRKMTELAMLTAVALIIFVVELQIPNPIPIPGVKLGLANIITVFALYHFRPREVLMLVLARIVMGCFFSGNMMALMYSLAGGLLCLSGMVPLRHILPKNSIWIGSVLGAVLHNVGQILAACLAVGLGALFYLPPLLISGCAAGAFTGICAQLVIERSWRKKGKKQNTLDN